VLRRLLANALIASGGRAERDGRVDAACRRYRAAARLAPRDARAHLNLGAALEAAGDAASAFRAYESALAVDPANPYAAYNLGRLQDARGAHAEAELLLQRALQAIPDFFDARVALANTQEARGELAAAADSLKSALELRPAHGGTWYNYAELQWKLGSAAEAERALRRAAESEPGHPLANFHVARLENSRGNYAGAERRTNLVLGLNPQFLDAWCLHAEVMMHLGRPDEAERAARRAIQLDAKSAAAWYLLGLALRSMSRVGDALEALAASARLAPERMDYEPTELLLQTQWDGISAQALFERHRDYGARLEARVAPRFRSWRGGRDPERRLRIGYLSCDFNRHPVAWFMLPLLERLDRERCEVRCYSVGAKSDELTAQLRAVADGWCEAAALSDEALADLIHADAIDILVDLIGYAGIARHGVFARQPAPVQASWLGYLHSTGMTRMQYRITDARADPPGSSESLHTERLVYLPQCQWCYRPPLVIGHAAAPPCARNGHVTFGSFQHAPKLSPGIRALWADILRRMPTARLTLVGVPAGRARDDLQGEFQALGIAPARLTVLPRLPLEAYLRQYDDVDIALDTTPYGGGTTTFEALWMGVPVLTLAGDRSAARSATSILGALDLHDWIAATADDYVRLALAHAADPARLGALRRTLRPRLGASALMDEARFARDMEAAYRSMWREWCARPLS
jgi:protein O-GlcNAc transferase